jgi:hypothetical protein
MFQNKDDTCKSSLRFTADLHGRYQVAGFDDFPHVQACHLLHVFFSLLVPAYRYLIRNDRLEKYAMLTVRLQPPNIQPSILSGMPFTHTFRRCDSALPN